MVETCRYIPDSEEQTLQGMSCWTFLQYAYRKIGIVLPSRPEDAQREFTQLHDVTGAYGERYPMDLIYLALEDFGERHVGLTTKRGYMLHCSQATNGVAETQLGRRGWETMIRSTWRHKKFIQLYEDYLKQGLVCSR